MDTGYHFTVPSKVSRWLFGANFTPASREQFASFINCCISKNWHYNRTYDECWFYRYFVSVQYDLLRTQLLLKCIVSECYVLYNFKIVFDIQ